MLHFRKGLIVLFALSFAVLGASQQVSAQYTVTLMQDNFDNSNIDSRWLVKWNNCSQDSVGSVSHAAGVADACGTTYGYAWRSASGDRCMVWKGSFSSANHTNVKLTFWYRNDSGGSIDAYVLRNGSWTLSGSVGVAANWTKQEYSLTGTITGVRFDLKAGSSVTRRLDCVSITGDSTIASSGRLGGPFVPDTGTWATLNNGGFETGNMTGWPANFDPQPGYFTASNAKAARGNWSAKSQATAAGGFANWQQNIPVFPGQTYVLSGFFHTSGSSSRSAWTDLYQDGWTGAPATGSLLNNFNQWQFLWIMWVADRWTVNARIVRWTGDGNDGGIHYDEIALTPVHNFTLPVQCVAPSITAHPESQTECVGNSVSFSVTATGTTLSYQWKKNGDNVGSNSPSYTINSVASGDAADYTCYVWNNCGNATSNVATLTVNDLPSAPTEALANPGTVYSGDPSTLSATVGTGEEVEWFTGSCGETPVTSPVSPITTTTYYARAKVTATGCVSETCAEVTVTVIPLPIGEGKKRADEASIVLPDKLVIAVFSDHFYIGEFDRSSGIRVTIDQMPAGLAVGKSVDVQGTLATTSDGERVVEADTVDVNDPEEIPDPLVAIINKALGGGNYYYNAATGAGQMGVEDGVGTNNIGLLVKTCGVVTGAGEGYFYINDGTDAVDFSLLRGVRVRCEGLTKPESGDYVCVTGISSIMKVQDRVFRSIQPRTGEDMQSVAPPE